MWAPGGPRADPDYTAEKARAEHLHANACGAVPGSGEQQAHLADRQAWPQGTRPPQHRAPVPGPDRAGGETLYRGRVQTAPLARDSRNQRFPAFRRTRFPLPHPRGRPRVLRFNGPRACQAHERARTSGPARAPAGPGPETARAADLELPASSHGRPPPTSRGTRSACLPRTQEPATGLAVRSLTASARPAPARAGNALHDQRLHPDPLILPAASGLPPCRRPRSPGPARRKAPRASLTDIRQRREPEPRLRAPCRAAVAGTPTARSPDLALTVAGTPPLSRDHLAVPEQRARSPDSPPPAWDALRGRRPHSALAARAGHVRAYPRRPSRAPACWAAHFHRSAAWQRSARSPPARAGRASRSRDRLTRAHDVNNATIAEYEAWKVADHPGGTVSHEAAMAELLRGSDG